MTSSRPFPPRLPEQNASVLARQAFAGSRAGRVRNADPLVSMGRIVARASAGTSTTASTFWYEDNFTVSSTSPGTFALTYLPRDNSEDIKVNGVGLLPTTEWTRSGTTLTVNSSVWLGLTGSWDLTVQYEVLSTVSVPLGYTEVPGTPLLWLKADSLSLADGTAVSSWPDSSANAYSVTQATGANQPIFKTGIVNGMPVLRFNGTSQQFDSTCPTPGGTFSIFAVFAPTVKASNSVLMGGLNNGSPNLYIPPATGIPTLYDTGVGIDSQATTAVTYGSFNSLSHRAEHITSTYDWMVNGTAAGSGTAVGTTWVTTHTIGIGWTPSPSYDWFYGDLAELVVYTTWVSDGDRDAIHGYFQSKYGVA